ncbi:MAG: hypothetical protein RIC55_29805 [Pirellulaceae bacterium]
MTLSLPTLRVGEPLRHESLCVFPLFAEPAGDVAYRLADEALAEKSLVIEEISESGSVPELLVENQGDLRVLFLEGEELVGAKQNRVLNTSVLVAAHSKLRIPVSCVEQGRWAYKSRFFGSSGSHSPSKLRRALKASVSKSVKESGEYRSDQGQVWKEVACLHAAHGVASASAAMSDAFDTYQDRIAAYRRRLKYVEGASGAAVAIGKQIVALDVFDKPATCRKVWDRLLSGVVFDALEAGDTEDTASTADVEALLAKASAMPWEPAKAIGEGDEYRADSPQGDHASALVLEQCIVHGSLVAAE